MTLPEGVKASGPTEGSESLLGGASGSTTPSSEEAPETPEEVASDSKLRVWAKDNGIDGVPASGRLSATWRDQITSAMAAALGPKEEDSAPDTSSDPSTSETETGTTEEESPTEEIPVAPEFETGTYRSVFKAPNTFVSSQAYTT